MYKRCIIISFPGRRSACVPIRRELKKMKRLFARCTVLISVLGISMFSNSIQAQVANNTALVGTVLDSSGSAVAGAKVTAVEESTGVVYPGTTSAQGYYSIKFIPPGTYDITV